MQKKTAVNYLLVDGSGSMASRTTAVDEGLESIIAKLKKEVPESKLVVIFFGSQYAVQFNGLVKNCPKLTYGAIFGQTALWGSLLWALNALAAERADYKSLTVLSDGEDTGNQEWCRAASREKAAETVKVAAGFGCNIGLMATGIDAFGLATTLGIKEEMTTQFEPTGKGATRSMKAYSDVVVRSSRGERTALTQLERNAIDESPEDIAKREGEELITLNKAAKLLQKMYEEGVNQFFSVSFKARTPPYANRTYAQARFNVVSKMKGANGAGAAYNFLEKKLVPVWVMDKYTAEDAKSGKKEGDVTGFRSIPLDSLIAIRAGGKAYRVKTGG